MPTDDSRLPLMPVLPSQRPPTTRDMRGRFLPGVSGNLRGRPTNARLATKRAALGEDAALKHAASYEGITPEQFVRLARVAYGKSWQGPLAADLMMSRQGVIRWAKGKHKISLEKETLLLLRCLQRVLEKGALPARMPSSTPET